MARTCTEETGCRRQASSGAVRPSLLARLSAAAYACWRPLLRRQLRGPRLERVGGSTLLVLPEVFNPRLFRTGAWLAQAVPPPGTVPLAARSGPWKALDMGTGSGIGAIFAARLGYQVTAVDVNPHAVRCARINALLNGLDERIEVRQGDLFAPVAGERFDLVLFNPPFFHGAPRSDLDAAWRSEDVIERFAAGLPAALAAAGRALVLLSSAGGADRAFAARVPAGLRLATRVVRRFAGELITIVEVTRAVPRPEAEADGKAAWHGERSKAPARPGARGGGW
jgi:HemK-related putative methylase